MKPYVICRAPRALTGLPGYGHPRISGDPIVVVLAEQVSDAHPGDLRASLLRYPKENLDVQSGGDNLG
jgi:hypothetical protein